MQVVCRKQWAPADLGFTGFAIGNPKYLEQLPHHVVDDHFIYLMVWLTSFQKIVGPGSQKTLLLMVAICAPLASLFMGIVGLTTRSTHSIL